jgi:hypothetical protein
VNLSQKRIDAIVARAERGLTDESDDAAIDANLDTINELTPFKEIAALDDHQRAKEKKDAQDKEAARLKAIEEGKTPEPDELPADTPEWMKTFMKQQAAQNKVLEDKIASLTGDKIATTRREQYAKALEGTSDAFKTAALEDFDLIGFKDDTHFTDWLGKKSETAKGFIQDEANSGLGGDRPGGGSRGADTKGKPTDAQVDALADSIL